MTPQQNAHSKLSKACVTPQQNARSKSAPLETVDSSKKTKSASKVSQSQSKSPKTPPSALRKRHPAQMKLDEFPKSFHCVKEVLFLHIKMLWGLFQQNLVPPRVDPELLKEFHNKFKEVDQVEKVLSDPNLHDHLVAQSDIVTLNQG